MLTARPQNHIGPGQDPRFVVPAFAAQLKAIAQGRAGSCLRVGNLESEREFLDVRDVARAYRLLIEKGRAGEAYNIARGNSVRIREVLDALCRMAGVTPQIEVDPSLYRPSDSCPLLDVGKVRSDVGWQPGIDIEQSLQAVFESVPGSRRTD